MKNAGVPIALKSPPVLILTLLASFPTLIAAADADPKERVTETLKVYQAEEQAAADLAQRVKQEVERSGIELKTFRHSEPNTVDQFISVGFEATASGTLAEVVSFVDAIEEALGMPANRNMMEMQKGDVPATWADASLLQSLTGYRPETDVRDGIAKFVAWYREYYNK